MRTILVQIAVVIVWWMVAVIALLAWATPSAPAIVTLAGGGTW